MFDLNIIQKEAFWRIRQCWPRLPHALLITGGAGIGKLELGVSLAKSLLCLAPAEEGLPCGQCVSCHLFDAANHPDWRLIQPDTNGDDEDAEGGDKKRLVRQIKIHQIREIENFFNVPPHIGLARVCLIEPVEAMNAVTANALLKILEEPTSSLYFIMISHRWRQLLPTLRSRCQRIICLPPDETSACRWLHAHGLDRLAHWLPFFGRAPLRLFSAHERGQLGLIERMLAALARRPDPLDLASELEALEREGLDAELIVDVLQKWLSDHAVLAIGGQQRLLPKGVALAPVDSAMATALIGAYRQLTRLRSLARHPLNPRLFLEDLCLRALAPWHDVRPIPH